MATQTVERPAHDQTLLSQAETKDLATVHEREKQFVASVLPAQQRMLSPFLVSGRPEEKQLGFSAKTLRINDFELLQTLGTGACIFAC